MSDLRQVDFVALNRDIRHANRIYLAQLFVAVLALVILCIFAEKACAQQPPLTPLPAYLPDARDTLTTDKAPFQWRRPALLAASALIIGDGISTRQWVRNEYNPIARPLTRSDSGQVLACTLGISSTYTLAYILHRTHHPTLERWLPRVVVAIEATAIINNSTAKRR